MKRCMSTVWLRGACILSAILLGTSMGGVWPTASGQTADSTGANADSSAPAPMGITITVPQEKNITYNLAAGAISPLITLPANQAVFLMGVNRTIGYRGVGQVTLLKIPSTDPSGGFIEWVGLESTFGAAITDGFSSVPGTHILFIDYDHQVAIEVGSPDTIRIHNASTIQHTGHVKLIY